MKGRHRASVQEYRWHCELSFQCQKICSSKSFVKVQSNLRAKWVYTGPRQGYAHAAGNMCSSRQDAHTARVFLITVSSRASACCGGNGAVVEECMSKDADVVSDS